MYSSAIDGWNYIESQDDVSSLMSQAYGFHDSVLKDLNYVSGAYVDKDKNMHPHGNLRKVTMHIESQWCQSIELIFEGVTALNLRPAGDNYSSDISQASCILLSDEYCLFQ